MPPEAPALVPDLPLHDLHPDPGDMRAEILAGLRSTPRTLPAKYFYDAEGSRLFDRICELEEYYPTRTERSILEREAGAIAAALGEGVLLIELGSGSSTKTDILLRNLDELSAYVPLDISKEHLLLSAARVDAAFPGLPVHPVCADFTNELTLPAFAEKPTSRFVFFPGSTIGNFDPAGQLELLERAASLCRPEGGGLLLGIDLVKDVATLEAAYNDREGVTAEFNRNLLARINRDLDADFDLAQFAHRAIYDEAAERIEMSLVSRRDQRVHIGGTLCEFAEGEAICTEYSHKFRVEKLAALAGRAGFELDTWWSDPQQLFAILLLRLAQ